MNAQDKPGNEPSSASILAEIRGGGGSTTEADAEAPVAIPEVTGRRLGRRVSLTNIVVALIVTVSASSLYLMRKQGKGAGMTFQVTKIDYDADKITRANADQERILAELARTNATIQVQVERIPKNPFVLDQGNAPFPIVYDPDLERRRSSERERQELEQRAKEIRTRITNLELNGIMAGPVPLARISSRTVRVGDTIADFFLVVGIEQRSVKLLADGQNYTLEMK
jgi:flagellar basal body-associated protein FliL